MAFRTPVFNLWAEVVASATGFNRGWTPLQLRGPTNTGIFLNDTPAAPFVFYWEILLPKGSDVKNISNGGAHGADDIFIRPGNLRGYRVIWVDDKAAGFTNEYRLVWAQQHIISAPLPRVNSSMVPPGGYTPLPVVPIAT